MTNKRDTIDTDKLKLGPVGTLSAYMWSHLRLQENAALLEIACTAITKRLSRSRGALLEKSRKLCGPAKPFLVHLYLKTER